ncbi:hypothetical protein DMB65_15450 [Flavobacterium cheongpyeongense]|uniref:Uncharacterized protein n=1 Tax=Flavobacterium cheongpyeongense TaxID=2212651 RepID=A0A2V4BM47_9FLAO|nr:hypothetical protein [Flavobacterium cheongpyeongense]PXY39911.1 hypothetical protein DMB65_15450 [Flavobacterium cheongpyeongense]
MKQINKIESIRDFYSDWEPSDIAFIKEMNWSKNNLKIVLYFQIRNEMTKWPDLTKDFVEATFEFKNVNNMKLNFIGNGLHFVSGFDIINASDHGLENINFYIEDYENGSIGFSCEDIEIISLQQPALLPNN